MNTAGATEYKPTYAAQAGLGRNTFYPELVGQAPDLYYTVSIFFLNGLFRG